VHHKFVQVYLGEVDRGVGSEDGNRQDDLVADFGITMVLEAEDNVAGVSVMLIHKHSALQKKPLEN
jgi:hypothetical protein